MLGNKKDNVTIIYTPWSNLKKDGSMAVGQVSFKDNKKVGTFGFDLRALSDGVQVRRIIVPQRENPIVNRLNKTKVEKFPDLALEKEEKLQILRKKDQTAKLERVSYSIAHLVFELIRETEEGRSQDYPRAEREKVAKGPCV